MPYTDHVAIFNIYDFGPGTPDPTGATDASAFFIAAASAASTNGGGIVFAPPGTYRIATTIALDNYTQLVGSDQGDTVLFADPGLQFPAPGSGTNTTDMVTNKNNVPSAPDKGTLQYGIGVRNIALNGNALNLFGQLPPTQDGACIDFASVFGVVIQNCRIYNCANHAISVQAGDETTGLTSGDIKILDNTIDVMANQDPVGTRLTGNLSIRVTAYTNVSVRNNVIGYNPVGEWTACWSNDGIDILHCTDVNVTGNQITYVTDGIGCDNGYSFIVTDNIVENYQGYGIRSLVSKSATTAVTHLVIARNVVTASTGTNPATGPIVSKACIVADAGYPYGGSGPPSSQHYSIAKNTVKGPTSQGLINCGAPFGACTGNSVDLNSTSVSTYGVQYGIYVKGSYVAVKGNEVFDSGSEGTPTGYGMQLVWDPANSASNVATGVTIDGNAITNMAVGIDLHSRIKDVSITDNNVTGCTAGVQTPSSYSVSDLRIAGNLGANPPAAVASPMYVTTMQSNPFPYDCMVTVVGTMLTGIQVNNHGIAWPTGVVAVKGPITVKVPVNGSIKVSGTGGSWTWMAL